MSGPTVKFKLKKWEHHYLVSNHPYEQKYVRHVRSLECVKVIHLKKKNLLVFL